MNRPLHIKGLFSLVGAGRFERPTPCAQDRFRRTCEIDCFLIFGFQAVTASLLASVEWFGIWRLRHPHFYLQRFSIRLPSFGPLKIEPLENYRSATLEVRALAQRLREKRGQLIVPFANTMRISTPLVFSFACGLSTPPLQKLPAVHSRTDCMPSHCSA